MSHRFGTLALANSTVGIGLVLSLLVASLTGCTDETDDVEPVAATADVSASDVHEDTAVSPPTTVVTYTQERIECAERNPTRNLYWGDLHVHTGLSFDAWTYGVKSTPADAYRFAQGETLMLPPLDAAGDGTRPVSLDRPLDFAAVTDHAEMFGEIFGCTSEESAIYSSETCVNYRAGGQNSVVAFGLLLSDPNPKRFVELCGGDFDCVAAASGVWSAVRAAAQAANDTSADCGFTSFVAYEYSGTPNASNMHRNVIFRNNDVPDAPISYFDEPTAAGLWSALKSACLDADGKCDVLAIPHNTNQGNGNMFRPEYPGATTIADETAAAALRGRIEPLVEIFQHKGDSECKNGFESVLGAPDELCGFEKLTGAEFQDCGDGVGFGGLAGIGCLSRRDYVRNILKEGLLEDARLGANPFRLGFVAGTDTHAALAGSVSESNYPGHLGTQDDTPEELLKTSSGTPGGVVENPGGLTAVWAVENSRDAIFDAMLRREVYATSGPRMAVRLFGGAAITAGLCDDSQMLETAYRDGVPMGGELAGLSSAPSFLVQAARDPHESAGPLEKVQMIKGWVDASGNAREAVFDVAGTAGVGSVDPDTCSRDGAGHASLCTVWTDPDFDAKQRAFYYARVIETPSCRWSTHKCNALPEADRPPACAASREPGAVTPATIRERAWTSPIWVTP
ncbi:MAG: hypothetical protein ACI9OJ_001763 [Myxococcota bacterium]|jgi:hypothetical protein